jgi:chorismate synthase
MSLKFLTAGESHGPALVVILEGLPAGLFLDASMIDLDLRRRQVGVGAGPRMKIEQDHARLMAGVMEGKTTGAPLAVMIENRDHAKWRGKAVEPFTIPRPGHADLSGAVKYGYADLRPALERASARETAARVAVGAVCKHLLAQFDIRVGGYVSAIGDISADLRAIPLLERPALAEQSEVRCPDSVASAKMTARIRQVMQEKDTLGGVVEVLAWGVPAGLGSYVQWDRRLDARLGAALLSIQAVKGVEIGPAFENAALPGTQAQDGIYLDGDDLVRSSLRNGGLEGGVTTGQPVWLRAALKPIATTLTPQASVDLARGEEVKTQYERSDFCPVPRAVPILEGMLAFVLAEALLEKMGGDSLDEMLPRFKALRQPRLSDLRMAPENQSHIFWPED